MRDQGIINGITGQILLAKGRVHAANAQTEHALTIPKRRNVFEIEVALAQMNQHVRLFPRREIDLGKEINLLPNWRLDKQPELVHAKFPIGKQSLGTAVEQTHAAFGADGDFAEGRTDEAAIVYRRLARACGGLNLMRCAAFDDSAWAALFHAIDFGIERIDLG